MTRIRCWFALFLALGCAPEPKSAATSEAPPPAPNGSAKPAEQGSADAMYLPEIDSALAYMAKVRELPSTGRVQGTLIAREALLERLRSEVQSELEQALVIGNTELLFSLNLVGPRFDFVESVLELFTSEIAGFYDPSEKRMYLLSDLKPDAQRMTLWHELVHALQDQHYDLQKLVKWSPGKSDRVAAVQCLSEGDATSAMLDAVLVPEGKLATDMPKGFLQQGSMLIEGSPSLAQIPAVLKRSVIAPYADGIDFTHALRRAGGWAGVDSAWRRPPASTEQILHPEKYVAGEEPEVLPLPPAPPGMTAELAYDDVLGEQTLRLVFEEWMPVSTASSSASDWSGDRVAVYTAGDARAVALRLRYDTAVAAERAAKAFVRGGLTPEIEQMSEAGQSLPFTVTAEAADKAFATSKFCAERPLRGPVAVLRNAREIAVTMGGYSRNDAGVQAEKGCDKALAWARAVLAAK